MEGIDYTVVLRTIVAVLNKLLPSVLRRKHKRTTTQVVATDTLTYPDGSSVKRTVSYARTPEED